MIPKLPNKPVPFVMHFVKYYWVAFVGMIILEAGQAACQILIPYAIKQLIDNGSQYQGSFSEAIPALKPSLILFFCLSVGILLFSRSSGAILVILGPALRRRVRKTIYHYLQYHSQKYFLSNFAGSLANRISEIAMGVSHCMWTLLFDFWPVIISFSTSLYLMSGANSSLAWMFGSWVTIYVLVSFLLATKCQEYAKKFAAARSTVSGKIVDGVTNTVNSKLFARLEYEREYLTDFIDIEVKAARKTFWFMEGMRWFQFIATTILQIAVFIMALKFWLDGRISVGSFAMITSLALLVINDARGLSRRFLEFFEYIGNIADGVSIIVKPHEITDVTMPEPLHIKAGEIRFEDVTFAYENKANLFENLNVVIPPGQRVGLVGFSGSGKTTFTQLILRMYDLKGGQILIDGQNIRMVEQDRLREQISMIPQEPMLFHRSLMENIRYGRQEATDDEIFQAAQMAQAHDFIMTLPEKYDALVGERGVKLSGGQRQRIAIARAILKNAPLLVMDEATSSLDSVTERSIQNSLEHLMKDKTVVVVAHRLSTIAHLHRILVFDSGRIVEDGTHDELLRKNGHYALLWSMQAGGFLPREARDVKHDELI